VCRQQNEGEEETFQEESAGIRTQIAFSRQISDPSSSEDVTNVYLSILSNKYFFSSSLLHFLIS